MKPDRGLMIAVGMHPKDDGGDSAAGEDLSDEELVAADDFFAAIKSRDRRDLLDAFRALKDACEYGSEPDADDTTEE